MCFLFLQNQERDGLGDGKSLVAATLYQFAGRSVLGRGGGDAP